MGQRIVQVDSFADRPFAGNPAAVCILDGPAEETWMQQVAAEMNLSETAFLYPQNDGYNLRWFTPAAEVELCGHATLAAAHVLWEEGHLTSDQSARFQTQSGLLTAKRAGDAIELNFPARLTRPCETPPEVTEALSVEPVYVGRSDLDYLVEVASEKTVRGCQPDFGAILRLSLRGLILTSRGDESRYDFVSRFFAPAMGINEDPVTGAAHCMLGPYWAAKLGKREFSAYQASQRGGEVGVRVEGERVVLSGRAITVMRCELV
ncbi:MAG: PhzF family phenazine biosynthesis protein [bacterium]